MHCTRPCSSWYNKENLSKISTKYNYLASKFFVTSNFTIARYIFQRLVKEIKKNLFAIGASSYIIKFVICNRLARSNFFSMLQIDSSKHGTGILNLECVTVPLSNNRLVIPLDATFQTISCFERKVGESIIYMKSF